MPRKSNANKMAWAKQSRGNSNPFDWTIELVSADEPAGGKTFQLHYGTWVPIGTTGLLAHAETHEQKPRVLIAGVDSTSAFGQPLPVPVKVWKWGNLADQFVVQTVGFYLYPNEDIEIRAKSFWLECSKN